MGLKRHAHQHCRHLRLALNIVLAGFSTALVFYSPVALAQSVAFDFDIPAQDLKAALGLFAQTSGQQIAYDAARVRGRNSHALHGRLPPNEALNQLLEGTGMRAASLRTGVYAVTPVTIPVPTAPAPPVDSTETTEVIIVKGLRASLRSAMFMKRNAPVIRDSIVAEDIGKLPDYNLAEALQRVSGIQIGRDRGEGNSIAIRGLTQVKTLINGREIFSDVGRDFAIEYVPTDVFSNIDVYKDPSASMIEGGVGGVINMRTHYPFDFSRPTVSLSVRANAYDLVREVKPQVSALFSKRFNTSVGEIGVLMTIADIRSASRLDSLAVEPVLSRYNLVDFNHNGIFPGTTPPTAGSDPGDLVLAPNGGGTTLEIVERRRTSGDAVIQWRPNDRTEVTLELTRFAYDYKRDAEVVYANRGGLPAAPGATFTFADGDTDAKNLVQSGTYDSVAFTSNTNYFDRSAFTDQMAVSANWTPTARLKIHGDLAFTQSARDDTSGNIRIGNSPTASSPTLTFDLRGKRPSLNLDGFNAPDASLYHLIDASHTNGHTSGSGLAAAFDARQNIDSGAVKSITIGIRYADHDILSEQGTRQHMNGDQPISVLPEAASPLLTSDFYLGKSEHNLLQGGMLGAPFSLLRDKTHICQALGDPVCEPPFNPLNTYGGAEKTSALYAEATYATTIGTIPVTGNVGGRYLDTQLLITGYRTSNTAQSQSIEQKSRYNNFLPSFNARLELSDKLFLRLAAAKQLTRPNFQDLAPNLFISLTALGTFFGRAGNPNLKPLRSSSYDASFEYYFTKSSYAYLTLFKKDVEGFIQIVTQVEPIAFPDYPGFTSGQISRPQNGGKGMIDGYEIGFQSFLDFLPTPLDGIGVQANYTRVDSHTPGAIAGTSVPLVGLSKNSYNLVAYYEKGPIRGRIAYSYRDNYVDTIAGAGSGNLPLYARPFGTLDASIGLKLSAHADVTIDAANILRAEFSNYFGNTDRPRFRNVYDRRVGILLRLTY